LIRFKDLEGGTKGGVIWKFKGQQLYRVGSGCHMPKGAICQNVEKVCLSFGPKDLKIWPYSLIVGLVRFRSKVNLNEISHNSAMGLVKKLLDMGVLLAEVRLKSIYS
jgi:hypothetical protein